MAKTYNFIPCVDLNNGPLVRSNNGTEFYNIVPSASTTIPNAYLTDPMLNGKVEGFGSGWQKFTIPFNGICEVIVRGASGGVLSNEDPNNKIDPDLGITTGWVRKPGRGAKITARVKFKKNDVLD